MPTFFTKKQKMQMRERIRRKKKMLKQQAPTNPVAQSKPHHPTDSKNDEDDNESVTDNNDSSHEDDDDYDASSRKLLNPSKSHSPQVDGSSLQRQQQQDAKPKSKRQQRHDEQGKQNMKDPPNSSKVTMPSLLSLKQQSEHRGKILITVPSDLSSAAARKFRKEARRKAREQGQDDSLLEFVVQASESETQKKTNSVKRSFPCLKDLVEQERQTKRRKQLQEHDDHDDTLTEEYKSRYVAMDCEMVGIGSNGRTSALARVSLVDWYGKVMLDTFVQVPTRVTDFRTHVSGVTPQHLKQRKAMDLKECRTKVAALLKDKILVGHALHNDLSALMLQHPRHDQRDTATYRPFQRLHTSQKNHHSGAHRNTKWRPRKLRDLVKEHVQLDIQQPGQAHDSIQDAWAAMQLFQSARRAWEQELTQQSSTTQKT